jgi:hypothetical protein
MADRPAYREDEIEARRQVVALAKDMLAGRLSYFEGAVQVWALQSKVGGLGDHDPDFVAFLAIVSDTDHLPLHAQRPRWAPSALERLAPEFKDVEEWVSTFAPDACKSIIARFDINDS